MSEIWARPSLSTIFDGSPPSATSFARTCLPAPCEIVFVSTRPASAATDSGVAFEASGSSSAPAWRRLATSSPVTQLAIVFAEAPSAAAIARSKYSAYSDWKARVAAASSGSPTSET